MAKEYNNAQLSNMAVQPNVTGRMIDTYPQLKDAAKGVRDDDAFLRFCAFVYDPQSPMAREYPDVKRRKEAAASLTGYEWDDAHIPNVRCFLKDVIKSLEYRVILANENAFNEFEERVYDKIDTSDEVKDTDIIAATQKKTALLNEMRNIATLLPKLKTLFYGEDEHIVDAENKAKTPESMAYRVNK